jgi:hypothetical protein
MFSRTSRRNRLGGMFLTIAHYTIADGNEAAVLALVAELEAASREEPGCLSFDAYLKTGDADSLLLLERYVPRRSRRPAPRRTSRRSSSIGSRRC